jgi:lactoylglutathione lyase
LSPDDRVSCPTQAIRIEHLGVWTHDLERMRRFYVDLLGCTSGPLYENAETGFRSCFVSFAEGARIELMTAPGVIAPSSAQSVGHGVGYAHLALELPDQAAVREVAAALAAAGTAVTSAPRTTGDGYYEAVVLDPDGNSIELLAAPGACGFDEASLTQA